MTINENNLNNQNTKGKTPSLVVLLSLIEDVEFAFLLTADINYSNSH